MEDSLCIVSLARIAYKSRADGRFKNADGEFGKPEFTIPDADDGDAEGDETAV